MKARERIYIIPTRYGFLYGLGILVTLSAGAIYANNLVYLLCFFLVALTLIGMVQTHSNLKGLSLKKVELELSPAQSKGNGKIWLSSLNHEGHNQLVIESLKKTEKFEFMASYLVARGLSIERFSFTTLNRGKKNLGEIKVSSTFPFGLFYAWRKFKLTSVHYVFPKPEGKLTLPDLSIKGESFDVKQGQMGDDFTQHRKYQLGESHKHIDWKAYARGRPLLIKEFKDGDRSSIFIDIDELKGSIEDNLSQIAKWIEDCEQRKIVYGLKLNELVIEPNLGWIHRDHCLIALAEYKQNEAV
ncbi:MAG: DUF58 domain-containing protein [Bdellovibrionaceae bacterium]|nr:DUF58 domain-containing protein [Pseudobdellovibrionaceae bacterium]